MTAMLHGLVTEIAEDLRAGLTSSAEDDQGTDLVATLSSRGLLDRPGLVSLLLRFAEEEQVEASRRSGTSRRESPPLQGLISNEDPAIAAAAMALILARGRRKDRFGQLRLDFDDLAPEDACAIVYAVAAAIAPADSALVSAMADSAGAVVQRHDPSRSLDALGSDLTAALDSSGRLSDEFIGSAAEERDIALLVHGLARRAGLGFAEVAEDIYSRDDREIALLLRMAAVSRDCAAIIVSSLCDVLSCPDPEQAIDHFDGLKPQEVETARAWRNLPADYRISLLSLGKVDGQRPL